jgi:hypothetical protein
MSKHVKNYAEFVNEQKALLEYDRSSFRNKYSSLPDGRMNKIMDYSKERQIKNGISLTGRDTIYNIIPSDIKFMHVGDNKFVKSFRNAHKICSGEYKGNSDVVDYERVRRDFAGADFDVFNKELNGINNEFDFWITASIEDVVVGNHTDESIRMTIGGSLVKLADKFNPPFQFNVEYIKLDGGVLTPTTPKDAVKLSKSLEDIIIKNFDDPRSTVGRPYIQSVKITRNAFFR